MDLSAGTIPARSFEVNVVATAYPVMLNLEGRGCVVVGGGEVAARKVSGLLAAGAWVRVISPMLHPDLEQLAAENAITVRRSAYAPGSLFDLHLVLVFAATDSPPLNQRIAALSQLIDRIIKLANELPAPQERSLLEQLLDEGDAEDDEGDFSETPYQPEPNY